MVQRKTVGKIVVIGSFVAATAFFVLVPQAAIMFGGFSTALVGIVFPIITLLPVSTILILTFVGFGTITAWAAYKKDLRPVVFPGSLLVLPSLVATILMVFSPTFEWHFTFTLLLPLSAVMLAIFVGLAAIVASPAYRQDMRQVLKLIAFTLVAFVLSIFFQLVMFFLWALALRSVPFGTEFITGLVIVYLYWPSKKRRLFLRVFGAILVLELALLLTTGLIT